MTDHPDDRPTDDRPTDDRPTDDRPADDVPTDDVPGGPPEVDRAFERASALHDGEGDDLERVTADDAVRADARSVAALARRLGDVPPAPPGVLDDHVAAAMVAFDEAPLAATAGARVTSLAARRPWWQRVPLGAVAAVVAAVALVGAIGLAGGDDDADTTATAAFDVAGESGDDSAESIGPGDTGADAAEGAAPGAESFDADGQDEGASAGGRAITGEERPVYGSYAELAAALQLDLSERATTGSDAAPEESTAAPDAESSIPLEAPTGHAAAGCDAVAAAGVDGAAVERVVRVVVDDRLVTAVVHGGEDGRRVTSVDEATCAVVDDRPL